MTLWLVGEYRGTSILHEVPATEEFGAGRGSDNELVLPSQTASRNHARLKADDILLHIEDLGTAHLLAARLKKGQPPKVVAEKTLTAKQLDAAYRSGITGSSHNDGQAAVITHVMQAYLGGIAIWQDTD